MFHLGQFRWVSATAAFCLFGCGDIDETSQLDLDRLESSQDASQWQTWTPAALDIVNQIDDDGCAGFSLDKPASGWPSTAGLIGPHHQGMARTHTFPDGTQRIFTSASSDDLGFITANVLEPTQHEGPWDLVNRGAHLAPDVIPWVGLDQTSTKELHPGAIVWLPAPYSDTAGYPGDIAGYLFITMDRVRTLRVLSYHLTAGLQYYGDIRLKYAKPDVVTVTRKTGDELYYFNAYHYHDSGSSFGFGESWAIPAATLFNLSGDQRLDLSAFSSPAKYVYRNDLGPLPFHRGCYKAGGQHAFTFYTPQGHKRVLLATTDQDWTTQCGDNIGDHTLKLLIGVWGADTPFSYHSSQDSEEIGHNAPWQYNRPGNDGAAGFWISPEGRASFIRGQLDASRNDLDMSQCILDGVE